MIDATAMILATLLMVVLRDEEVPGKGVLVEKDAQVSVIPTMKGKGLFCC